MPYGVDVIERRTSSGELVREYGVVHHASGRIVIKYPYDGLAIAKARAMNARASQS